MSASTNSVLKPLAPKRQQKKESSELVSSTTQVKAGKRKANMLYNPTLGYAIPPPVPQKVARRNARERNRVKQVNGGFEMLRTHIPSAAKHKKMSKVDTLRHAVEYIQSLTRMLNRNSTDSEDIDNEELTEDEHENNTQIVKVETPLSPPPEPQAFSQENYESGYETASYYSCNSMISPVPQQQNYLYNNHGDQQYLEHRGPGTFNFYPTHPPTHLSIEPNSEEDELLDAIANWQDAS